MLDSVFVDMKREYCIDDFIYVVDFFKDKWVGLFLNLFRYDVFLLVFYFLEVCDWLKMEGKG